MLVETRSAALLGSCFLTSQWTREILRLVVGYVVSGQRKLVAWTIMQVSGGVWLAGDLMGSRSPELGADQVFPHGWIGLSYTVDKTVAIEGCAMMPNNAYGLF
jgi:hypothetical protein